MTKTILGVFLMSILSFGSSGKAEDYKDKTAYDFSFTTLMEGEPLPLSQFKGKVVMVVNTASECGFTGQYEGLEEIYNRYKNDGFVVIGVPSNDFGKQEPGDSKQIAQFCKLNYGVSFPMASKEVVSGENAHPFYQWAKQTLGFGTAPKWNFHKYPIDREGKLVDYFNSPTAPTADRVQKKIKDLLSEL